MKEFELEYCGYCVTINFYCTSFEVLFLCLEFCPSFGFGYGQTHPLIQICKTHTLLFAV